MEKEQFIERLIRLRLNKGVSARDMSLSLGQSPGYINNIENGINLPSMTMFFYICDYLNITPKEFFDDEDALPGGAEKLLSAAKKLTPQQLEHLIAFLNAITAEQ